MKGHLKPWKDGVVIYDPFYAPVDRTLHIIEKYLGYGPVVFGLDPEEALGYIIQAFDEAGFIITIPTIWIAALLVARSRGRLYRGVRVRAEKTVAKAKPTTATLKAG